MAGEGFLVLEEVGLGVVSRIQEKEDWVIEGRGRGRVVEGGGFEEWGEGEVGGGGGGGGGAVRVTSGLFLLIVSNVGDLMRGFVDGREMGLWVGESGGEGPFRLLFSAWEESCSVSGGSDDRTLSCVDDVVVAAVVAVGGTVSSSAVNGIEGFSRYTWMNCNLAIARLTLSVSSSLSSSPDSFLLLVRLCCVHRSSIALPTKFASSRFLFCSFSSFVPISLISGPTSLPASSDHLEPSVALWGDKPAD